MGRDPSSSPPSPSDPSEASPSRGRMLLQVIIVGAGFMCDAYDLFVINNVLNIMRELYPQSTGDRSMVASTALWGAVAGQLFLGALANFLGRKVTFALTLVLIAIGAIGSSLSFPSLSFSIYQQLSLWRFLLGFGVGGEYPLAASISAERSAPLVRGRAVAAVFSMQGIGQLLATGLINILLAANAGLDFTWRFALAFGSVPALCIFYFRTKMHESREFKEAKETRVSHLRNLRSAFRRAVPILGTSLSWFLLDISFYGNGHFDTTITRLMGLGSSVQGAALSSLYVTLMAIPGYYFTVAFLDRVGRWNLQMGGFLMLVILFIVLAAAFYPLQCVPVLFILLYGLTYFFSNFGPNTTTFIISGEYFPSEVKATCHGIAAASGKIGAAVAGWAFPPALDNISTQGVLYLCAAVGFGGMLSTLLVPKYKAEDLEGIKAAQLLQFESTLRENRNGTQPADVERCSTLAREP